MPQPAGRTLSLSLPRRFVCDLIHFAHQHPTVPVERRMNLARVVAARQAAQPKPGWCAIFTKAYARVAARFPELRRCYLPYPWPHLYEHPISTASVGIERRLGDEDAVFFVHVRSPDQQGLPDIDRYLRRCKEEPIEQVSFFRKTLFVSSLPRPLRRFLWWAALYWSGKRRAKNLGTFGISVVAALGAAGLHLLSPLTTALNYGVIGPDGTVDVRLTIDQRVLDPATAARALQELENVLLGEIVNELGYLRAIEAA